MKTKYYKIFLFLFIPLMAVAHNGDKMKGKYTKEKSLKKEFSVNKDALLKIHNDYGNLDITSWNEDRIVMEITIKVNGNDEEKVIEKLESIDVRFEATPQNVNARTVFDKESKSWWNKFTSGWNNSSLKMEINYNVKVPVTNSIDLSNDYGSITVDKIEGKANINCDYGQILIGELLADNNYITIDYTHNSSIKYMKSGKINADYSDFTLTKGEDIELSADYTQSTFEDVNQISYNCDYGGLKIRNAIDIKGNGDYLDTNIGKVGSTLNVNSDYGSIDIDELKSSFKNLNIRTDYAGVRVGYDAQLSFDFDIKSSYGSIKLEDNAEILTKDVNNSNKIYKGYLGNKNSGATIQISTSYGGIKLTQN